MIRRQQLEGVKPPPANTKGIRHHISWLLVNATAASVALRPDACEEAKLYAASPATLAQWACEIAVNVDYLIAAGETRLGTVKAMCDCKDWTAACKEWHQYQRLFKEIAAK